MDIKQKIKASRKRSVILNQGEPTGRTNALNPGTMNALKEAYIDMQKASAVPMKSIPIEPIKRMPAIEQRYQDMGDAMGICPYELRDIMGAHIGSDEALVFTLLKKFVTAAKLAGSIDFSGTRKTIREAEDRYRAQRDNWELQVDACKKANIDIGKEVAAKTGEFDKAWGNILVDLVTKLDRNADITSLGAWDRLMVMAIAHTGDEFCTITKNVAKLDFSACKRMKPDVVVDLPKVASVIQKHEEDVKWQTWLSNASVDQMVKQLWNMGVENDDEEMAQRRQELEWAIIAKSGRTPVRDRWGNLNWHATFNNEPVIEDDFSWEEEREREKLEAWKEALQRQRDKAVRVNSGKGKNSKLKFVD